MLRVLLISHTCQSASEGQPRAEALARTAGISLRVVVPDRWRHYGTWRSPEVPKSAAYKYDVQPVRFPWVGPAQCYLHYYPMLGDVLREFQPQVIDLWEEPWSLVSAMTCRLRNRLLPDARIVSETEQNIDKKLPLPFERFRRYTLSNASFAIGRSHEAVEVLRRKGYSGAAAVVPNGVDIDRFKPRDRDTCRREIGASGFVVGYVGRLVPEKGLDDLLTAVALCAERVNLVVVGDGPMKAHLQSRVIAEGLDRRVKLLPSRPPSELPVIMNALDALVLPSRTTPRWKEQFGRVIVEAMACGIPVIGSNSGAIPEVIGTCGMVVPERSPQHLSDAITHLAADEPRQNRFSLQGRQQVIESCSWSAIASQMSDIYCTVAAGPSQTQYSNHRASYVMANTR